MAHEDDPDIDVPLPKTDNGKFLKSSRRYLAETHKMNLCKSIPAPASSPMEESSIEIVFDSTANSNQNATSTSTPDTSKPSAEATLEAHSFKCDE